MPPRTREVINASLYARFTLVQNISAREGLRLFRQAGGRIGNQRWFELVRSIRSEFGQRVNELEGNFMATPAANEIQTWENLTRKGYFQQVNILLRDRDTGELTVKAYTGIGRVLRSRREIIMEAIESMQSGNQTGNYNQDIIGVVYTGTYTGRGQVA